ncbi:MAG: hypothetical protein ACYTAN_17040 [Planctomycetota bacterium]|jgi:hypothetical protein
MAEAGAASSATAIVDSYGGAIVALDSTSTLTDAVNQYKDNARPWESAAKRADLLEAVNILIMEKPETLAAAGCSASYADLRDLQQRLSDEVQSDNVATRQRVSFVRGIMRGI